MGRDRAARPEAKPLRLFVAVAPPPEAVAAALRAVEPWRERLPGGRWERPEKMHFTLKFLGRAWPRLVGWIEETCRRAASEVEAFEVRLGGLGVFPGPGRARVLWVGADDPRQGFRRLAAGLDEGLASEFKPEKRAFTPHLTVARFRTPVLVKDEIEELRATEVDAPPFLVEQLRLVRSHLSPRGSRYETVGEFPLGAGA